MKLVTGFFMAWGNFLALPCPLKRWDNDLRHYMLAFLPAVGLVVGLLWGAVLLALVYLGLPYLIMSFIVTLAPFLISGFQHLDGFMDCCDAILSRRPLPDRQAILKDSHTGAFAVIGVVFLLMGYQAALSTVISLGLDFVNLCLLPVVSRSVSGACVLLLKPMSQSQYASTAAQKASKGKALLLLIGQLLVFCGIGLYLSNDLADSGLALGTTAVVTLLAILYGRHQLGGMSGDIAGWGIVWGDLAGVIALALV